MILATRISIIVLAIALALGLLTPEPSALFLTAVFYGSFTAGMLVTIVGEFGGRILVFVVETFLKAVGK